MARANHVAFDHAALLGLMREKGYTQEKLADATGISLTQLCGKLNGKYPFKQTDIQIISDVLGIKPADIGRYFFTVKVEKTQHPDESGVIVSERYSAIPAQSGPLPIGS